MSLGYTHEKTAQKLTKNRWCDYISELAWSRLSVQPVELSEIAEDRELFGVLSGLLSR